MFLIALAHLLLAHPTQTTSVPLQSGGWIGGDRAYTVRLDANTRLWLFGDSWVGDLVDGRRSNASIINNSVAIESVSQSNSAFQFYWGKDKAPFFKNHRNAEWYWPMDGVIHEDKLVIILQRVWKTKASSTFGFESVGADLATVEFRNRSPSEWKTAIRPIAPTPLELGVALVVSEGYIYAYASDKSQRHQIYLARIALSKLDLGELRFEYLKADGTWNERSDHLLPMFDGAPEMSVRWDARKATWIVTYSPAGLSRSVVLRTAIRLEGPWGEPQVLIECPEMTWKSGYYCYEGKQLAPLSPEDRFSITYLVNSFEFWDVAKEAQIYVPRILHF